MKKSIVFIILFALILSSFLFTGCANKVLYGTWKLQETINANTMQQEASSAGMFANMMYFTINRDGTVTFLNQEFGTFTKSRNEFTFTYNQLEDEEPEVETGAWELDGGNLRIWLDDTPVIYNFVRVESNEN